MTLQAPNGRSLGEELRDAKTSRVRRRDGGTARRVQRAFLGLLMEKPEATTDELRDVVSVSDEWAIRGLGAAMNGLARDRLIRCVGFATSKRSARHANLIRVWTLAVDHVAVRRWLAAHPEYSADAPESPAIGTRETNQP